MTDYSSPFFDDYVLPAGRLRESRGGAKRANIVVVTKCPADMKEEEMNVYHSEIRKYNHSAEVFFSSIQYDTPKPVYDQADWSDSVVLFSGIANDQKLKKYVDTKYDLREVLKFPDHHHYSSADLERIKSRFDNVNYEDKSLITTEKDMVKTFRCGHYG